MNYEHNMIYLLFFAFIIVVVIIQLIFDLLNRKRHAEEKATEVEKENIELKRIYTAASTDKTSTENMLATVLLGLSAINNNSTAINNTEKIINAYLTKRELELAPLLIEGLSSKEIAEKLSIAVSTANNHIENMKEKTGCKNRSELVGYLLKNNII